MKGTKRITQTDANGKFTLKMNPGETLQVTYVGYQTEEFKPGDGPVGVSLKTADNMLGEVVVRRLTRKETPENWDLRYKNWTELK